PFGFNGMRGAHPMDRAVYFTGGGWPAGLAAEVGGAVEFHNVTGGILHHLIALDDVRVFKTDFAAGTEPEIFRRRILHEIIPFNVKDAVEGNFARAAFWLFRIVSRFDFFDFSFGIIRQNHFDRAEHREP